MGYGNVFVYDEGFPAWIKAGYPYDKLNILPKVKIPAVDGAALKAMIDAAEDIVILDVRDSKDLGAGRIAGAINITLEDMMARYKEIPTGKKVVIVDLHGKQTQITGRYLLKQGYTSVVQLDKGMKAGWIEAGYPVE